MEAFILTHSIGGGTGSGLGSFILEKLNERFPKKLVQTYSVFPDNKSSDVVTNPYNSILTLKRLIQNVDSTIVFQNSSINKIINEKQTIGISNIDATNQIISQVMANSTSTLRFP